MDAASILSELIRLRRLVVVAVLLAALAAASTIYRLPSFEPRSSEFGAAQTQLLVDSGNGPLADINKPIEPLASRAVVYARFMTSAPVRQLIAREAGIPFESLDVSAPFNVGEARFIRESPSERRANELLGEERRYRMLLNAEEGLPIVTISTQAPTAEEAERLADAGVAALADYLSRLYGTTPVRRRIEIRPLGEARGGMVVDGTSKVMAVMVFIAVFVLGCVVILTLSGARRVWRRFRVEEQIRHADFPWVVPEPVEANAGGRDENPVDDIRLAEPSRKADAPARR